MKKISKKTIEKISKTKLEASQKKILEGISTNTIPKQSQTKLAVPSHRTRKNISFEDFKKEIEKGRSINNLVEEGVSKHLLGFYSVLSKGKITLTKEEFENEYTKGIPLDEIGKTYGISREHITYLREYYGIKRKGATYLKRLKNEVELSQEAKDVVIGSLLGDGHITPLGYFSEKHSEKQVEYLEWKGEALKEILTDKSFSAYPYFDKRYGHNNYSFCLRTKAHSFLYEMRKLFYKEVDGKTIKVVPEKIEDLMNEKVLAVWFMDDGHTDWGYRHGERGTNNLLPQSKISSQSFSFEENVMLQKTLENKFNIVSNIRFHKKNKKEPFLKITSVSSKIFFEIIKPFITNDLIYKIDEQSYLNYKIKHIYPEEVLKYFMTKHKIFQK
jgi:hypothetical protein